MRSAISVRVAAAALRSSRDPIMGMTTAPAMRSEEHTSELQSLAYLVCRLLLENDPTITEIYTLSLHDALPIYRRVLKVVAGGGDVEDDVMRVLRGDRHVLGVDEVRHQRAGGGGGLEVVARPDHGDDHGAGDEIGRAHV